MIDSQNPGTDSQHPGTDSRSPGTDSPKQLTPRYVLSYDSPAERWTDALPLGNGLLGAMCFGGAERERFQLNHTTGWSGSPGLERSSDLPSAEVCAAALSDSRAAIERSDWAGADQALKALQHGNPQSFVPVADLTVSTVPRGADASEGPVDHRRTLDLGSAVHRSRHRRGATVITSTGRASHPDNVLMITVDVEGGEVDLEVELDSPLRHRRAGSADLLLRFPSEVLPLDVKTSDPVRYSDREQSALDGAVCVQVCHDGVDAGRDGVIRAYGVRRAVIWVAIETSYVAPDQPLRGDADAAWQRARERIRRARDAGEAVVAERQEDDHRALFERCLITLGDDHHDASLDERLARAYAAGPDALERDPGLAALLFAYGRYLLICSSRDGGLPANLQGIWNDNPRPPWSSDFTMNINLEMNYWAAEPTGLVECLEPFFGFVEALARNGRETAGRVLGTRGWAAFHCSDAWAYTQPVGDGTHDPCWAFWPMAGPWLLQIWRERLLFGGSDAEAARAWPVVHGAVEFLADFLVELPDGTLGTSPSTSPENHFTTVDAGGGATAASSTLDIALARDTFTFLIELAGRLGRDDDPLVAEARSLRRRLPEPVINSAGMISEWPDPRLTPEPDHRHTAHLYPVHPGVGPLSAELAAAADASLTGRGDESTGWSLVWKAAMRARLRQPDRVADLFRLLFRDAAVDRGHWAGGIYRNLFTAHPPFQIDANFGFVTALAECLLQSHAGTIDLLPALPALLGPGSVRGLVARPGVLVDLDWDDSGLTRARLRARRDGEHRIRYRDQEVTRTLLADTPLDLTPTTFR